VGYVIREVYTGAELWDRRKLSQVRADLKSGQFAALICYSTDRLSRDPIHLAILAEECERAGVALHFVSETFDDSDEAALIRYVKGYSSKNEREKIRERSMRGKYQRALNGKIHNMGPEKYGWRRDKAAGVRVLYEPEAAVVRRIFTLVAEERRSYYSIGRLLSAEGVPAPGAARFPDRPVLWKADTIMRIIRDPAYKGEAVAWQWKRAGRSRSGQSVRIEQRPAEERVPLPEGVVPAIVDADLWQREHMRPWRRRAATTRAMSACPSSCAA
jgi:site-specific DNA recombinase